MSSTQRMVAIIVVWISVAIVSFFAVGSSLFLPVWAVLTLTLSTLVAAVVSTALIVRSPW